MIARGPAWLLRHERCRDSVCVLTLEEYEKISKPDGLIAERVMIVSLDDFLQKVAA